MSGVMMNSNRIYLQAKPEMGKERSDEKEGDCSRSG